MFLKFRVIKVCGIRLVMNFDIFVKDVINGLMFLEMIDILLVEVKYS